MGIKLLNKYITNTCDTNAVKKIHIKEFSGKKIAVDASIYMYRFLGENKLIEHMYLMTSIFRAYKIIPVFIFDGIPPPEKYAVIQERKEQKLVAQTKYELLKKQMIDNIDNDEKYELEMEMEKLKKQFIRIKEHDIITVKEILDKSGISWIHAPGEADELCAYLSRSKKVDACMSEDMDMFAYGCPCILRNFSIVKQMVLSYNLPEILSQQQMNMIEFRQILSISGTDYNKEGSTNLYDTIKLFREYKNAIIMMDNKVPSFYDWIEENSLYIHNRDTLENVFEMFETHSDIVNKFENYNVCNQKYEATELYKFLEPEGFIFIQT